MHSILVSNITIEPKELTLTTRYEMTLTSLSCDLEFKIQIIVVFAMNVELQYYIKREIIASKESKILILASVECNKLSDHLRLCV